MLNFNNAKSQSAYRRVNFDRVNEAALPVLSSLVMRWLPRGKVQGCEYVARNPRRADQHFGSFKVNLGTGRWADFATGDSGGDPVSLAAFLANISPVEAAKELAGMLGVEAYDA
jgi:hypothetical protein